MQNSQSQNIFIKLDLCRIDPGRTASAAMLRSCLEGDDWVYSTPWVMTPTTPHATHYHTRFNKGEDKHDGKTPTKVLRNKDSPGS